MRQGAGELAGKTWGDVVIVCGAVYSTAQAWLLARTGAAMSGFGVVLGLSTLLSVVVARRRNRWSLVLGLLTAASVVGMMVFATLDMWRSVHS